VPRRNQPSDISSVGGSERLAKARVEPATPSAPTESTRIRIAETASGAKSSPGAMNTKGRIAPLSNPPARKPRSSTGSAAARAEGPRRSIRRPWRQRRKVTTASAASQHGSDSRSPWR
jgi:hypothetical protein